MKTNYQNLMVIAGLCLTGASVNAVSLNLASTPSGTINGAFFIRTDAAATGTGLIDSFVRLGQSGNNTTAEGYNADARPVMPDVNTSPSFTHDVRLGDVPIRQNPQGLTGLYLEFLLDINQNGSDPLLSLDKIQIYTRATALTTADTLAALTAPPSVLRYNLDAGTDSEILLNYNLNSGSGSGDMFAYIPVSTFIGANVNDKLYLYSMFGGKGGVYAENDGFEEWATKGVSDNLNLPPGVTPFDAPTVPDGGATLLLLGTAFTCLGAARRFIKR